VYSSCPRKTKVFIERMREKHGPMLEKAKMNPQDDDMRKWVTETLHFGWFKKQKEYFQKMKIE